MATIEDPYVGEQWPVITPHEMELLETYLTRAVISKMSHDDWKKRVVTDLGQIFEVLQGESVPCYVLAVRDDNSMAMRQLRLLCGVKKVSLVPMNKKISGMVQEQITSTRGYHAAILLYKDVVEQDSGLLNLLDSVKQPPMPWLEDLEYRKANIKV